MIKRHLIVYLMVIAAAVLVACGGVPTETTGAGGSGGSDPTSSAGGGGSETTTGAGAGPFAVELLPVALDPDEIVSGINSGECGPVTPADNEDGSWVRVAMHPLGGAYSHVRVAVIETGDGAWSVPDGGTWVMQASVISSQVGAENIACGGGAAQASFYEVVDQGLYMDAAGNPATIEILDFDMGMTFTKTTDTVLLCVRNFASDTSRNALVICGVPDAGIDGRDQWQDSDAAGGAIHEMCDYGPSLCGMWMAEAVE